MKRANKLNAVAVAVTGAIVGAGVAIAGALALKDKKNQDKVKAVLAKVKDKAVGYVEKANQVKKLAKDTKKKASKI